MIQKTKFFVSVLLETHNTLETNSLYMVAGDLLSFRHNLVSGGVLEERNRVVAA